MFLNASWEVITTVDKFHLQEKWPSLMTPNSEMHTSILSNGDTHEYLRPYWLDKISTITRIPVRFLLTCNHHNQPASVAQRMSWASNRTATRTEDRAYSLLGLLNVNMSLIYGEGDRAFARLQHEIIRNSDDDSILAWAIPDERGFGLYPFDFAAIARDPSYFARSDDVIRCPSALFPRPPYCLTHKGLDMETVTIASG
jgi:hypothetical protein